MTQPGGLCQRGPVFPVRTGQQKSVALNAGFLPPWSWRSDSGRTGFNCLTAATFSFS